MSLVIQKDLANPIETKEVWYDGAGGQIAVGYSVCYDPAEDLTAGATEFGELERYKVVKKPATANLQFYAGVVVDTLRQSGSTAGPVRIAIPRRGAAFNALCKVNATVGDPLAPTNGEWHLAADAAAATATSGAGASVFSRNTVAVAGETANTSVTAANKVIFGVM